MKASCDYFHSLSIESLFIMYTFICLFIHALVINWTFSTYVFVAIQL